SAFISVKTHKLTVLASLAGLMVGLLIFAGAGYTGMFMLGGFFILATIATTWKKTAKQQLKPQQAHLVKRDAGQVLANGGLAGAMGLLTVIFPSQATLFSL